MRSDLQNLGADLVAHERESFCRRVLRPVLEANGQIAVIDGLRHRNILDALRKINAPGPVAVIYVDAPFAIRLERVKLRDGLSAEQLSDFEKHSTEIEVERHLKGVADFIADNSRTAEECSEMIASWVKRRGPN